MYGQENDSKIIRPIPVYFYPSVFQGEEGQAEIRIAIGLPHRFLDFQKSMFGKGKSSLNLKLQVVAPGSGSGGITRENQIVVWSGSIPPDPRGYFLTEEIIPAPPGESAITVEVFSLDKSRFGRRELTVTTPDFSADTLTLSSIQPAYRIDDPASTFEDASEEGLTVVPYPFATFIRSYPVYAYFEAYNLRTDDSEGGRYAIEYRIYKLRESVSFFGRIAGQGKRKLVYEDRLERVSDSGRVKDYITFDPDGLDAGHYALTLTVTDMNADRRVTSSMAFEIIDEPSRLLP